MLPASTMPSPAVSCPPGVSRRTPVTRGFCARLRALPGGIVFLIALWAGSAHAVILWSDLGATQVHETGSGMDILGGALKRVDSSSDTLYFKFHVSPLSDSTTEEYFAAFELYEGDAERLGVGNASKAWAYSAFFNRSETTEAGKAPSYIDLRSSTPEPPEAGAVSTYEFPRRGTERTIIFKVQYVAGGDDLVTVWLNPDLGPGANEVYQPESLTTRFNADASFDEIRLRHGGGGGGWTFSDMAIATSFTDFVDASSAKPQTPGAGPGALPFSFKSWQRAQGMPLGSIRALTQTIDGYLWAGGDDGLARFDGVRFVAFEPMGGLHGSPIHALFGDGEGQLWVGTAGRGLTRYRDGQFTTYTIQQGLPSDFITALAEDGEGKLWVGTDSGLAVWQNGRFVSLAAGAMLKDKRVTTLFRDLKGTMWLGARGAGVFQFRGGEFAALTDSSVDGLLQDPNCLLVDRGGRTWIGAGDDFVLCHDGGQWNRYRIPRHLARPYVKALAEEPDGTVWAGSVSEGLFQFKDGKLAAINASSGLSDNLVDSLLVDHEGRLWVGTDSGLNRMRRKNIFVFDQEAGLGYGSVLGLAEVAPGVVWAAKRSDGLYRWEGKTFNRLTAAGLPPHDPRVNALLVARDASCWVACGRGLLHFKDPQAVADESALAGLANFTIISLAEDAEGRIWAGTREGRLWKLFRGNWTEQTNLAESHPITAIVPAPGGWMWVGTDGGGLCRFKDEPRARFTKGGGLLSDSIRTLWLDSQDALWIGTSDGGLSCWRDGKLVNFTTTDGLPDNTISQIVEDDSGHLWLGCNHGIVCVAKNELEGIMAGKNSGLHPQVYGREEDIRSEECTTGFFPSGLKSRSGLLWFSTTKGIVVADPHHQMTHAPTATVLLEEVLVDGVKASTTATPAPSDLKSSGAASKMATLHIPAGKHRFEIQYTGLSFDAPERVRFRYRLEGLDTDWVEAGTRRTAFYNYVPPGDYRFQVIACDSDGVWNNQGASLALGVSRHFWQIWWVIALAALGLLASVGGTIRFAEKKKLQRRLKRLEQERALERERTRIAQDLHDEMGAKLCRISFLSEHSRRDENLPEDLRQQIHSISDASREVLRSLDEIVWAVNPQNDTLEHVASYIGQYAEEYFQGTGIECELDLPAQLPAHPLSSHARHHLFLAVREAFTNVLKHSGATRCTVSMMYDETTFNITTADNGAGFDAAHNHAAGNGAAGNGLSNMQQRIAAIGGSCGVESKPGEGTTIRFMIPINSPVPER